MVSPFHDGMVFIDLQEQSERGLNEQQQAVRVTGLPVIGFSALNYVNQNAQPGLLANYAGSFELRNSTDISVNEQ